MESPIPTTSDQSINIWNCFGYIADSEGQPNCCLQAIYKIASTIQNLFTKFLHCLCPSSSEDPSQGSSPQTTPRANSSTSPNTTTRRDVTPLVPPRSPRNSEGEEEGSNSEIVDIRRGNGRSQLLQPDDSERMLGLPGHSSHRTPPFLPGQFGTESNSAHLQIDPHILNLLFASQFLEPGRPMRPMIAIIQFTPLYPQPTFPQQRHHALTDASNQVQGTWLDE